MIKAHSIRRDASKTRRPAVLIPGIFTGLAVLFLSVTAIGFTPDPPPPSSLGNDVAPVCSDGQWLFNGNYLGGSFGAPEVCNSPSTPSTCVSNYSYLGSALYTNSGGFPGTYIPNAISSSSSPSQFQLTANQQQTINIGYTLTTQPLPPSPNTNPSDPDDLYFLVSFGYLTYSSCGGLNGTSAVYFSDVNIVEVIQASTLYYVGSS